MSATKIVPVVGVSFTPSYPANIHALAQAVSAVAVVPIDLRRNPANPHDPNAVEVHCPALPDALTMIGHVSRENAARLAPLMDAGIQFVAEVYAVRIDPLHPERPGVDIAIRRRVMEAV